MIYRQWTTRHNPAYRPSLADLWALAEGLGDTPPVQILEPEGY